MIPTDGMPCLGHHVSQTGDGKRTTLPFDSARTAGCVEVDYPVVGLFSSVDDIEPPVSVHVNRLTPDISRVSIRSRIVVASRCQRLSRYRTSFEGIVRKRH